MLYLHTLKTGMNHALIPVNTNILSRFKPGQFPVIHFFLNVLGKLPINKLMGKEFRLQICGMLEFYRCCCLVIAKCNIDL
jgi:hypothetical protein